MLYVHRTDEGIFIADPTDSSGELRPCAVEWDAIFRADDPVAMLEKAAGARDARGDAAQAGAGVPGKRALPLVDRQEVWAAGVTYFRSRTARMEESETAGGGSFYDRVYEAARPELFFKGNARTVVAPGRPVRIRADATWNVPEPELVLAANAAGRIIGYTAGNDMSSRDIEGENPLYLPQAKVYDGSCALGPVLVLADSPPDKPTTIRLEITRDGSVVFADETTLAELKRDPEELVSYLFRDQTFPDGCYLMTGTGIVPDDSFSLRPGDEVSIRLGDLPPLVNTVEQGGAV